MIAHDRPGPPASSYGPSWRSCPDPRRTLRRRGSALAPDSAGNATMSLRQIPERGPASRGPAPRPPAACATQPASR
jgi:hypothetical protein